jgi:hypothetical protein
LTSYLKKADKTTLLQKPKVLLQRSPKHVPGNLGQPFALSLAEKWGFVPAFLRLPKSNEVFDIFRGLVRSKNRT